MSGSVNKVIILGHLGRDPESRSTQSGERVVNLNIATSESWKNKQSGERQEKTEWHRVTIWNQHLCDIAEKYLRKGSKVYLEGSLETRKWTDQSGADKYTTEIVLSKFKGELTLLDSAGDRASAPANAGGYGTSAPAGGAGGAQMPPPDLDDDIPF